MTEVLSPVDGTAVDLGDVADPVFAQRMVGPGAAVKPTTGPSRAVAPVAGTIVKLHPHAYVIAAADGRAILVHLGIDTVQLKGEGFELLAAEGDTVAAGDPVVAWDPDAVARGGRDTVCPVIALDTAPEAVTDPALGPVSTGQPLFDWR